MSFFTGEKYKYWECTVEGKSCNISMIDVGIREEQLKQFSDKVKEYDIELEKLKEEKKENKDKISEINSKMLNISNERDAVYKKGIQGEKSFEVYKRYSRISYHITRLKDIYSRQEVIHIQILNNNIEDGIVITSISDIDNDIKKLEKYGISLYAPYLDELVKIIKNNYLDIEHTERTYIDNEVPSNVISEFVKICCEKIKSNLEKYTAKDKKHYDVPTTELNDWYKDTPFRRYTLRDIKEGMIIHGYMDMPTKGRMDNTIEKQKVVRLIKDKLDKMDNKGSRKKVEDKDE